MKNKNNYYIYYMYLNGIEGKLTFKDKKKYLAMLNRLRKGVWYSVFEYGVK